MPAAFLALWNGATVYVLGAVAAAMAVVFAKFKWKREGLREEQHKMEKQVQEQVSKAHKAAADAADVDVDQWLREHGYLREE